MLCTALSVLAVHAQKGKQPNGRNIKTGNATRLVFVNRLTEELCILTVMPLLAEK